MTYKNMLLGKMKYLILFLIAIQSVLLALVAIFLAGLQYQQSWQSYNHHSGTVTVYLQKLTEKQSQDVFNYFLEQSDLSIWTKRSESSDTGEGLNRIYIDILGSSAGFSDFESTGKIVVSQQQFANLLSHSDNNMTIGLDKGSNNMLYELPDLLFSTPVVIERLDYTFQNTNTINGIYHINGLRDAVSRDNFLLHLSKVSGISVEDLTKESFGSSTDQGIWGIILAISILVNAFILLILFLICVLQSFKHFGTLILLGWDRKELWSAFFKNSLLFSIYIIPIISLCSWLLSGWSSFGLSSFILVFAGVSLSVLLLLLIFIIPTIIVYSVSPLAAIHKRLPMKPLMVTCLLFYTLVAGLLIAISYSLDAPMNQFIDNMKVSREWKNVEDMYVISSFAEGDDVGTYAGTTNSLERSMYNFYQRISELPGVYIAQGQFLNQESLDAVYGTYQHVPKKPFWYLKFSYNYLKDLGIPLSDEELLEMRNGTRLYLLPNTLNTEELEVMKAYLQESVTVKPGDLQTNFTENPKFMFKVYQPSRSIFTWSDSISYGTTSENPVIFVSTPENLYFMESANLVVSGYNGLLKIRDRETMKQVVSILETEFPDLKDNRLSFTTVKNFINGLQKDLSYTFYLFGTIIAIIIITMMAIFWSFVLMYRMLFEEKLYVQYFMGFSPWKRYIGVLSLIISFSVMELIVSILVGSKLGIVMTLATFAFQIMLLYFSLFRKEGESIIQSFKE
ncbi:MULTISPECIES: ABC transporter membrane-spanning permease-amino acid transport [Streptococcus]|uniref:ABC transporter membrane-spanning permease-amino acid transport n=1 Tax=Streptococcus TaxID=1301 RepID=UPI00038B854B|nr:MULTISPECIES: ABC transporter membrane-spanning permease-amino acid transport [Streptococcus]EQC77662.1 ABC transporter membrane-spanning permease-amino acid transport [Streptococcus sp. HSISM1]MCB6703363.1 ABC transporter permease [Streptococcus parasanguinis]MCB6738186.1 ABC transporter permease [Streptococcus parasanguinis]MCB7322022.1 ABC transporter permease [Streptococcus parasanguinis]MCB7401902.1 ABC transporter permease [Streptococcus parasanguinis]